MLTTCSTVQFPLIIIPSFKSGLPGKTNTIYHNYATQENVHQKKLTFYAKIILITPLQKRTWHGKFIFTTQVKSVLKKKDIVY